MTESDKQIQNYNYVLQQEVLKELIASRMADVERYMDKIGVSIDDRKDPITILFLQMGRLENTIASYAFDDDEKLTEVRGFMKYIGEYIKCLCEANDVK